MNISDILKNVSQLEKAISDHQKFVSEQKTLLRTIKQQLKEMKAAKVPAFVGPSQLALPSATPRKTSTEVAVADSASSYALTAPATSPVPQVDASVSSTVVSSAVVPAAVQTISTPAATSTVVSSAVVPIRGIAVPFNGGNKRANALDATRRYIRQMYPAVGRFTTLSAMSSAQKAARNSSFDEMSMSQLTQDNRNTQSVSIMSPSIRDKAATSAKLKEKLAAIVKENTLIPIANPNLVPPTSSSSAGTSSALTTSAAAAPVVTAAAPSVASSQSATAFAQTTATATTATPSIAAPVTAPVAAVSRGKSTVRTTKTMTTAAASAAGRADTPTAGAAGPSPIPSATTATAASTAVASTSSAVGSSKIPLSAVYETGSGAGSVVSSDVVVLASPAKKQKTSSTTSAAVTAPGAKPSKTSTLASSIHSSIPTFRPGNAGEVLKELQKQTLPTAKLAAVKQLMNQSTVDKLTFNALLDKGGRALLFEWLAALEEDLPKSKYIRNMGDGEPMRTSQALTESLVQLLDKGNWTEEWLLEYRFDKILRRIYKVLFEDTGDAMSIKISNMIKTLWTKYRLLYKGLESGNYSAGGTSDIAAFSNSGAGNASSARSAASNSSVSGSAVAPSVAGVSSAASVASASLEAAAAAAASTVSIKKESLLSPKPNSNGNDGNNSNSGASSGGVGGRTTSSVGASHPPPPPPSVPRPPLWNASAIPTATPAAANVGASAAAPTSAAPTSAAPVAEAAAAAPAPSNNTSTSSSYLNISINSGNGTRVAPPPRAPSPPVPLASAGSSSNPPTTTVAAVSKSISLPNPIPIASTSAPAGRSSPVTIVSSAPRPTSMVSAPAAVATVPPTGSGAAPLSALNDAIPNLSVLLIQLRQINTYPSMYAGVMQLFNRMKTSPRLCESFLNNGGKALLMTWLTAMAADEFVIPSNFHSSTFCQMVCLIVKTLDLSYWSAKDVREFRFDKILKKLFKKHKPVASQDMITVVTDVWKKFAQRWKEMAPPGDVDAGGPIQSVTV